jgi:hypothetical protein
MKKLKLISIFSLYFITLILILHLDSSSLYSQPDKTDGIDDEKEVSNKDGVEVYDESIEVQSIYDGLNSPVFLGFAGPNDILVYEKQGFIKRVIDGDLIEKPVLKLDTQSGTEIFMKGIISKDTNKDEIVTHYIFLYYTQCDSDDSCRDLVYRYELDDKNNVLLDPKLLFSLKTFKDSIEDEGIIRLAPDNNLHLDIKNLQKISGDDIDSDILNEDEKGKMSWKECFIQTNLGNDFNDKLLSEDKYIGWDHGNGLSGSFGADFDPYSGDLWYLEDGPDNADEIRMLLQPADNNSSMKTDHFKQMNKNEDFFCIDREYYDDLKHIEEDNISLKSLLFLHSQYLGKKNSHNLLVSSDTNQIFQFDLDRNRSDLIVPLKSQDTQGPGDTKDAKQFIFAEGFNGLLDVRLNPYDGLLYILDKNTNEEDDSTGTIYRFEKKVSKIS